MAEIVQDWMQAYPIRFTPQGDLTSEAIFKACIQEIDKIYGHLNYLRHQVDGGAMIGVSNFVPTVDDLPKPPVEGIGAIYMVNGDQYHLYGWDGENWNVLNISALPYATEQIPGIVTLGTVAGAAGVSPSPNKVVTEQILAQFRNTGTIMSVPSGGIIAWWGTYNDIPAGWTVCDGTLNTPDLRGRFIKNVDAYGPNVLGGKRGGSTSMTAGITIENMPAHSHTFSGTRYQRVVANHKHVTNVPSHGHGASGGGDHTHLMSATTGSPSEQHTHTYSGNSTTTNGEGSHGHGGSTGQNEGVHRHSANDTPGGGSNYSFVFSGPGDMRNDARRDGTGQIWFPTKYSIYIESGAHTHSVSITGGGSHQHSYAWNGSTSSNDHYHTHSFTNVRTQGASTGNSGLSVSPTTIGDLTSKDAGGFTIDYTPQGNNANNGDGIVFDIAPPYYELMYLMKL